MKHFNGVSNAQNITNFKHARMSSPDDMPEMESLIMTRRDDGEGAERPLGLPQRYSNLIPKVSVNTSGFLTILLANILLCSLIIGGFGWQRNFVTNEVWEYYCKSQPSC